MEKVLLVVFVIAGVVMLPKVLRKIMPKMNGSLGKKINFTSVISAFWGPFAFFLVVLIIICGVLAVYRDIAGYGPRFVDVSSTLPDVTGEEVVINLVPEYTTQGGHVGKILLPPCKFPRVLITRSLIVQRKNGSKAPLVLHLGSRNKGVGEFPTLSKFSKEMIKGRKVSPRGAEYFSVLPKGAEIDFSAADDTMIWFSFAGGSKDEGRSELEFANPKVTFSYRELK
jgi:hypothetical protein